MYIRTLAVLVFVALASADFPLDSIVTPITRDDADATVYRLPEDLDPIHYDIEMTPYFEATGVKEAFTFDGIVTISVRAVQPDLEALIIQENVREVVSVTLTTEAGVPIRLNPLNPFERIRAYHFLKVNLANGVFLVNGDVYRLTIVYIGNINETPLSRGMFRGSTVGADGRTRWYAATHLQPTNSRQLFPSFDEPGFKSTFNIVINRPAHYTETYSNMRLLQSIPNGDRVKEIFQTTPRMSAYLVTVHISEDFEVIADNGNDAKSYRILARSDARGQGEYAQSIGIPITDWLSSYFGIDYYSMEENIKNDQIASPFWASGATENWGLVTYRELRLLYEEGETNALDKMYIGTITAHELAHKWFGNLITCRWWDNVWINEGFASYFEYFAMDAVDRTLELEDQFNIMYVQSALSTDSSAATRALQHTVNSPAEVTGHFSGISYSKGASLLLMLKHFLTEDTFKKALNYFLLDRSYEHAFPSDLYSAFARAVSEDGVPSSNFDIASFMQYWVDEPGYPVLNVDVNMSTGLINLSQERFFISATATQTDQVWPLPLTYTSANSADWNNLQASYVLTEKTGQIQKAAGHEWVIFNVQQKSMYRVNYDTHNWEMLASALVRNHEAIHHLNRAQIVDDIFALTRSEKMTYELGFQVLEFLKNDTSYYVWYPAITGFNWLRNRFIHLPEVLAEFDEVMFEYLDAVIADLGYNVDDSEPLTKTLNRFFVLSFACSIGHEACINDAVQKYTALRTSGTAVNPNIRRHVFCHGVRLGGYDEWRFLYERRASSNNQGDELVMLRALGCTTDDRARQEYLNMIVNGDVKAQDTTNAFSFFLLGDRSNARVAMEFFKNNVPEIRRATALDSWFVTVMTTIISYLVEEDLQDMEQWLRNNQDLVPEFNTGLSTITSTRTSMQWGTDKADIIMKAFRGSAAVALPTTMLLLMSLLAMLIK